MKKSLYWLLTALILGLAVFLRFHRLASLPPAPYWEEVALGYDAYSILKTGADHHGHPWPLVAFESFGDWKPSLYFYSLVPAIKFWGLNVWAVRLPAAVSGLLIVIGIGQLVRLMIKLNDLHRRRSPAAANLPIELIAMAVTAVSPWAIIFSRAAWEVNLATNLILWGVVFFLQAIYLAVTNPKCHQAWWWLMASSLTLSLSMYAYHAARVIAPLLGLGLAGWWLLTTQAKQFKNKIGMLLVAGGVAMVILWPLLTSLGSTQTNQRLAETNIFSELTVITESNHRRQLANQSWLSRIIYHRYLLFTREIGINLISHFNPSFLWIGGDANPRHSVQYFGQLYHLEIIFIFLGLMNLIRRRSTGDWFLGWWLVVGLIPAALTKTTPHALRILPTLPVWIMIISYGIEEALTGISSKFVTTHFLSSHRVKLLAIGLIVLVYGVEVGAFWRFYTHVYPQRYAGVWQSGYQQLMSTLRPLIVAHPDQPVVISRYQGRPAMYYWFYTQTNPRQVQAAETQVDHDQGEFLEFANIRFGNPNLMANEGGRVLVASSADEYQQLADRGAQLDSEQLISNQAGEPVWYVYWWDQD